MSESTDVLTLAGAVPVSDTLQYRRRGRLRPQACSEPSLPKRCGISGIALRRMRGDALCFQWLAQFALDVPELLIAHSPVVGRRQYAAFLTMALQTQGAEPQSCAIHRPSG